jgi:hypothetical protein
MKKRSAWDVTVRKRGPTYITQFTVGCQTFTIIECDIEEEGKKVARARAVFFQRMLLIALRNMGVRIPKKLASRIPRKILGNPKRRNRVRSKRSRR